MTKRRPGFRGDCDPCLALVTGLVIAIGTPWGLVRHYWVLIAFGLTSFALVILILHMSTVTVTAERPGMSMTSRPRS